MEELETRHRKEQRDLQSLITQKKKSASKKTRKSVNAECEELEQRIKERHRLERQTLEGNGSEDGESTHSLDHLAANGHVADVEEGTKSEELLSRSIQQISLSDKHQETVVSRKPNRQKARLFRRAAKQEAEAAQAAEEASNLPDLRNQERQAMNKAFQKHNLREKEIRPDGHCLYSAVADQLTSLGLDLMPNVEAKSSLDENEGLTPYKTVRKAAADYVEGHPDDFEPYIEETFPFYVHKIRDTAQWGGQLELAALAKTYGVEINVLQAGGQIVKLEPEHTKEAQKIWLAYYRHTFGLGEHYNSLRRIT